MGIKGLNKLIYQYAPFSVCQKDINEFNGKTVAIDSEILLHRYRSTESKNSHIYGFVHNVIWHLENGIKPIYVFDGSPSVAKQSNALTKRTVYKDYVHKKIEELENRFAEQLDNVTTATTDNNDSKCILDPEINNTLDQLFRIQKKITYMSVTKNHRNECKYLLKLLGVPFIVANNDAEAFCVTLQQNKLADYIYTEDTDIIPYIIASLENGAQYESMKILRRGYPNYKKSFTVIDVSVILDSFKLSPKSFVDMCILSGCDFCTTLSKIGHLKAYNYMNKYESIENMKANGINIPDDFKYKEAREIFFSYHYEPIKKTLDITETNVDELKIYLLEERDIKPQQIIDKYKKAYDAFIILTSS